MKWQLFEIDDEYVESYGREKTIPTFYPVDRYFYKRHDYIERKVEFDSPEEAENYIHANKEYFTQRSIYYCIPQIEII